jgi:hypothetical protein
MAEKRQHRRFKKRYTVRFGTADLAKSGITGDISKGGAFILTRDLIPLDTRVHLQVQLDAKSFVLFEGIVQRHRKVPPELRQMDPGGFGVRTPFPSPRPSPGGRGRNSTDPQELTFTAKAQSKKAGLNEKNLCALCGEKS